MAQYFFKISMSYTDKNKLYAEFFNFVKSHDNTLIPSDSDKKDFKNVLRSKLEELQKKHSRCKPLNLSMGNYYSLDTDTEDVRVSGSFTADIFKVKNKFSNYESQLYSGPKLTEL